MMNGNGGHDHSEEADSKQEGSGADADPGEEANEQEVIVIQDTGFTVKIQAPGTEPFDLQVSSLTHPLTPQKPGFSVNQCISCQCSSY